MSKPKPKFSKNAEQLARAFGLPLTPHKKKASLKIVSGWIADQSFPKKTRTGWAVEEVRGWIQKTGSQKKSKPPTSNLQPPTPNDLKQEDIFESDTVRFNRLLDLYEDKLFNPTKYPPEDKILVWQVNLLRQHRPQLFEHEPHLSPPSDGAEGGTASASALSPSTDWCDTLTTLAERLKLHHVNPDGSSKLKYELSKQEISDWRHGKRLNGAPPPPASMGVKPRHSLRQWIAWFDKYFLAEWKLEEIGELPGAVGAVMSLTKLKEQNEREQIEFDKWERQKELGKYILVESAVRIGRGQSRQLADYWRQRNEQAMIAASKEKLLTLGVAADLVTIFTDWLAMEHRKFTDDVESKASAAAEKYAEMVKVEVDKVTGI